MAGVGRAIATTWLLLLGFHSSGLNPVKLATNLPLAARLESLAAPNEHMQLFGYLTRLENNVSMSQAFFLYSLLCVSSISSISSVPYRQVILPWQQRRHSYADLQHRALSLVAPLSFHQQQALPCRTKSSHHAAHRPTPLTDHRWWH